MAHPAPVEMPAARLRTHDVLVAYGENATIVRPPVISVDGSMTNVLINVDDGKRARLVRLPVGLRVDVVRTPSTQQGSFVRSTKVARSSGARIAVLDLLHPDSEIPAGHGETYATLCTIHHSLKTHPGISTAQAQASHPEQWCDECATAARDMARQRVWGTAPPGQADEETA